MPGPEVASLLERLALRETSVPISGQGESGFDATSGPAPAAGRGHLFGGLVAAQAVVAAGRTVPSERGLHSLHAYFLRAGRPGPDIRYQVAELRDGGTFSVRAVRALQEQRLIFTANLGFCDPEAGISHQPEMPAAPPPEGLLDRDRERERIVGHRSAHPAIEVRMCEAPPFAGGTPSSPFQRNWIRVTGGIG
ncbi:MAG: thioesterase family protein, partial [Thermoanaerobaculia bacterium]|nr:thioesterase family protein [Thermoanaerobaculia bacterium]